MQKTLTQVLAGEPNFRLIGSATDGRQAVRLVLALKPELVLMDYRMPFLDGMEATRRVKRFDNPPRVIIVTSDDSPGCRALAKAAGADGLVIKGGCLQVKLHELFQEFFALPAQDRCLIERKPTPYARPGAADSGCLKASQ